MVSFLEGDPDQPLVTGRTCHADNLSPYPFPEHKTRTGIKTQTHQGKGFNELCFEDQVGEEFIYMHAQENMELHVLNSRQRRVEFDDIATIGNNSRLLVAKDRIETIDGNRDVTVHTNHTEQIDGERGLKVGGSYQTRANGDITFKADGELMARVKEQCLLAAACQNLKKIAQARWRWLFYVLLRHLRAHMAYQRAREEATKTMDKLRSAVGLGRFCLMDD
ncbi:MULTISPECIES: bacteriophage T4 gp5 trimerisation domain-containing protein [unclassified Halomonas]|uniref:bacteriophage T4 gp5 trimerisation domain-containing protein n=1 Tax=unclassified Halomonas TaxID=2609666 RepID=UPI003FB869FE